jgi:hypothetical protein
MTTGKGGTGKAEAAKLPGAGIWPEAVAQQQKGQEKDQWTEASLIGSSEKWKAKAGGKSTVLIQVFVGQPTKEE